MSKKEGFHFFRKLYVFLVSAPAKAPSLAEQDRTGAGGKEAHGRLPRFARLGREPGNGRKRPFLAEGKTFSGARTGVGASPAGPIAVIVQKVEVLIGFSPDRRNARFLFLLPHHGPARQEKAVSRRRRNGLLAIAGRDAAFDDGCSVWFRGLKIPLRMPVPLAPIFSEAR
ncbi:MAG: hypothetical protein C6W57_15155 [Caldibacillus debilis]|nr:MAG: hypothetical protein C6W57_15155 [Caldibacillus debilis]